jgi:pyruvate dehydrogenase E1 component alpha subunit
MKINNGKLVWMYKKMVEIRTFDEKVRELYMRGLVPGTTHLYIGQEAVAVGVCANLRADDYVFSTHRCHAHIIAKEVPLKEIAAEILGKATGCCKGKGGSMHLSRPDLGFLYSSAIVGGGVPLAVGAGLTIGLKKGDQVVASFFGDGASNAGGFHEGLNLASLWRLPVIFVCENNLYAISVSTKKSTSVENIADRALAYGMPGLIVDGNDVLAVYEATHNAVEMARKGDGPTLMECKTYRWLGHFAGDPGDAYRTREEVEAWKGKCPIKKLRTKLVEEGISREEEINKINEEVKKEVEEAAEFAINSSYPPPEDLGKNVF